MDPGRRIFLKRLLGWSMVAGLVASYGSLATMAVRFVYPSRPLKKGWVYVAQVNAVEPGTALPYQAPDGATINIARRGASGDISDFIALSSVCPHLGCRVHWQPQQDRFFCPCHNGIFNISGVATAGPPFQAGQSLQQYPLKIQNGLLYIEVNLEKLV